jgi:hypothetical protein
MQQLKKFFNIDRPYEFDITDITAIIYTICAIGVIMGLDMTVLFFIGSAIATAFCWQARKLNLVLLNASMFVMNGYYLITMLMG